MADPDRGPDRGPDMAPELSAAVSAELLARFRAAEERLYPLAIFDVERYQRGTALCALLLEDLRATGSDLATVRERHPALLARLPAMAAQAGLSLHGLDAHTLVDAAAAARCRELEHERARSAHAARIATARESGQEWLVDQAAPAEVMAGFFRRVELHLATGTSLVSTMEAGTPGRPTRYTLAVVLASDLEDEVRPETFTSRDAWQQALERQRSRISGRP